MILTVATHRPRERWPLAGELPLGDNPNSPARLELECARPRAQRLAFSMAVGNCEKRSPGRELLWPGTATLRIVKAASIHGNSPARGRRSRE